MDSVADTPVALVDDDANLFEVRACKFRNRVIAGHDGESIRDPPGSQNVLKKDPLLVGRGFVVEVGCVASIRRVRIFRNLDELVAA